MLSALKLCYHSVFNLIGQYRNVSYFIRLFTKNYLLDHKLLKDRGNVFRFLYNPLPLPSSICPSFSVLLKEVTA